MVSWLVIIPRWLMLEYPFALALEQMFLNGAMLMMIMVSALDPNPINLILSTIQKSIEEYPLSRSVVKARRIQNSRMTGAIFA